ncbi:MAG: recombinase family protein, partial [Promethearchaeota archaeon]
MVSIKYAARFLGVCEKTLRRWDKKGILCPIRTLDGHRRYDIVGLKTFLETGKYEISSKPKSETAAIYARVSSHKQKEDLKRQIDYLYSIAQDDGWNDIKIYKDIGSGLNDKRKSL